MDEDFSFTVQMMGDQIAGLSIKEIRSLCEYLEQKHGINSQFVVKGTLTVPGVSFQVGGSAVEDYSVILESYPADRKIACIKLIRVFTASGLKEAKDISESLPQTLKRNLSREEALKIVEEFREIGAVVRMK